VGIEFGSWNGSRASRARVDSASPGNHDDASLFWTSMSFDANPDATTITTTQNARTTHLVTRPVNDPAT
jgi:hypothetical protein